MTDELLKQANELKKEIETGHAHLAQVNARKTEGRIELYKYNQHSVILESRYFNYEEFLLLYELRVKKRIEDLQALYDNLKTE